MRTSEPQVKSKGMRLHDLLLVAMFDCSCRIVHDITVATVAVANSAMLLHQKETDRELVLYTHIYTERDNLFALPNVC